MNNLPETRGKYRFNVDLGKMCWFGVGGTADVVFTPQDVDDLVFFLKNKGDIPVLVFGVGSNILIRDDGFRGVVVRLSNTMKDMHLEADHIINVGTGVLDKNVSDFAMSHSIGGMEFLSGIPGTIGGGLAMNAGAYGGELKDIVVDVECVDLHGNIMTLSNHDMGFKYRGNSLDKSIIFLSTRMQGYPSDQATIERKVNDIRNSRHTTQPVKGFKTGGSTFKNPQGLKAWQLIHDAGCRGLSIGGAQISELHCNFLINNGDATAKDIEELIQTVKNRVFDKSGIMLEEEIVIVGEKV